LPVELGHGADKCPSHLAPILPERVGKVNPEPRRKRVGALNPGIKPLQGRRATVLEEPLGLVTNGAYFGTSSDPLFSRVGQGRPGGVATTWRTVSVT